MERARVFRSTFLLTPTATQTHTLAQVLFSGLKLLRNGGNASFLHKMVTGARNSVVRHLVANTTSENLQVWV